MNNTTHEKTNISVLVVEDSLTQAEEIRFFLESYNYTIAVCHDGQEALEWLQNAEKIPDVIVSDVIMPRMDGYEFCKATRADKRFEKIPVILLTSLSEPNNIIKSIEAGANKFLTKPFDHKRLPEVINECYINVQRRSIERPEMGVLLVLGGKDFLITADRAQILDLLLSSYEDSYYKNMQLQESRSALERLNAELEQKVQERTKELRVQEKQFRTLTEHTPDLVVRIDRNMKVVYVNKAVEDLFGIPREQLIGQSTTKLEEIIESCSCTDIVSEVFSSKKEIRKKLEIKRLQGVTWIDSTFLPEYDEEGEIKYVLNVSRDITAAKNNETRLIRQKELYQVLSFTNKAIVYSKTRQELFDEICRIAIDYGKFTYCWIATIDPKTQALELQSASCGDEEYIKELKTFLTQQGKLLLDRMLERSELIFNDIEDPETNLTIFEELARKYDYKSFADFLLGDKTAALGILTFCSNQKDFFDDGIQDLLREIVGDISFALNNFEEKKWHINAEETLLKNQTVIAEMLIDTVAAIATTVEMRDPYTAGHQKRVAALACAIAENMGIDRDQIEGLRLAALIHDLGKIQIPAEILSKPTRLREVEFLLIKLHPEAGYEILKDIEFPWPIAAIILQHHEKLDGSGYPHGLKGDEILLEARILTVADIVEAMASHRPYRAALGIDAALEEIQKERGIKLDADAVDACVALFKEGHFRFPEVKDD